MRPVRRLRLSLVWLGRGTFHDEPISRHTCARFAFAPLWAVRLSLLSRSVQSGMGGALHWGTLHRSTSTRTCTSTCTYTLHSVPRTPSLRCVLCSLPLL